MKAGLNIYSLSRLVNTESEFEGIARKLADMGYSYLQISGLSLKSEEIARVCKDLHLPVYLTHFSLDRILNDTEAVLRENDILGCKNIGLGYFATEIISDESKCREIVAQLNEVGEKIQKDGFTLFLHNHHNEFYKRGKQTTFNYIVENAPRVHFIMDTYWAQYGGEDPVRIFERIKGRVECVHLKDYRLEPVKDNPAAQFVPHFAPVGSGTLDFPSIVKAAKTAGAKYFFVEQDDAFNYSDALGEVKKSIDYIKENL